MTIAEKKINENVIQIKAEMDQLVEKIKGLDTDIIELNELFKIRAELLKNQYEEKKYGLEEKKRKHQIYLRELFEQVPQSETKTQRKVKLLCGDVVVKKSKLDFDKDSDKLMQWAVENNKQELINRKEVLSFKWADFKKNLSTTPTHIVALDTGEVVDIPGLRMIRTEEKLEIKY